ncbi:MAG: site-2 protease family protein [Nanoarchaeota archaeon]
MNWDLILLLVFYLVLYTIFRVYRNKFEVQWRVFALYKTKIGIKLMDKIAIKFPKTLNILGNISIVIGFLGMGLTMFFLFKSAYNLIVIPTGPPGLAPVLPGVDVPGLPKLSFWHWIISILIVATIHEFCHGIYSRLIKVKIKSTGFAFLGSLLAAFVEPDEKQLEKKKTREQLQVISAGPFSNIILAFILLALIGFVVSPIASHMVDVNGVQIASLDSNFQINKSGILVGDVIEEIDYVKIDNINDFDVLKKHNVGDLINVKTDKGSYEIELGNNEKNEAVLGVGISGYKTEVKEKYKKIYPVYAWIGLLLFWVFNISLGVGLFNLLPLGPVDGGRMFYVAALYFTKDKKKAMRYLSFISFIIFALILFNMWPFIWKLIKFIASPLMMLL